MPKGRFHEIYQEYLCGCVLRLAREVFALLPVETVLITASADTLNPGTGQVAEQPVLSVAITRTVVTQLDFDRLDPSDAMDNFLHRGDFKASRKLEIFERIEPLTPADIVEPSIEDMSLQDILNRVRGMREEVQARISQVSSRPTIPASRGGLTL